MTIPVIIDCDPGTDDAIALFLGCASPELDIRLISVVAGNVGLDRTLPNACALIALTGCPIPVVAGAAAPLHGTFADAAYIHGDNGIGGVILPPGPPAHPGIAADAIRDVLRTSPQPVTLVGIGPATNLALAIATEPTLLPNIAEIVLMTGAWAEGNATPAAEFNALSDPEALAILLAAGRPVTLATLELTAQALFTPPRLTAFRALPGAASWRAACAIMATMKPSARLAGAGFPQHDACAVMWLIAPELFTHRPVHAAVDLGEGPGRGRTVIDRWNRLGHPANATLLETLDANRFFSLLGERIAGLP